jgi:hypothetical protein
MRQRIWTWAPLFGSILLLDPGTRAQSDIVGEVRTENGLHRAAFPVPQGTIRVNFPDDLSVGDTISGTVYTEPTGKDPQELARNTGEITGYVVEMPEQKANTSDRRFRWRAPPSVSGGVVQILLRDQKNRIVGRCNLPVDPRPAGPAPSGIDLPLGAQAGAFVSLWGPFGSPPETSVSVGGKNADVIAESPRKLIFVAPPGVIGQSTIQVRRGEVSASGPFFTLGLQTSASKPVLEPGETAIMSAIVSGLQNLKEPASLVIVNHDPSTVAVAGGTVQHVAIAPAEVSPGGTFTFTRTLTGEKVGRYDITVAASTALAARIPIDRLAGRSVERWLVAQNVTASADARAMIVSQVFAARSQLDKLLIPQLGFRADLGTELDWLVQEYCFDLRDRKRAAPVATGRFVGPSRRPPFGNAFAPQEPVTPGRGAVALDASDVRGFSFTQFFARILGRLTPSDPLGYLLVNSQPDRQAIRLDQVTAADYFTIRTFVLSVGKHAVSVGSCSKSVTVNPNQQSTMSCP